MVYKVIGISGSLQKASTNTGLLKACIELKNPDLQIEIIDISNFPHLNPDLLADGKFPTIVQTVRQKVQKADAVLFAIPEYNSLVSAALKNAYDWISMSTNPAQNPSPIGGKVAGMLSSGVAGGSSAQEHFIQITQYCKVKVFTEQKVQVKRYEPGNFDQNGNYINKEGLKNLEQYLKGFVKFISKNK